MNPVNLRVGIRDVGYGWKTVLEQEGINFSEIDFKENLLDCYSVIIVNGKLTGSEKEKIRNFLEDGGSVLSETELIHILLKVDIEKKYVNYLKNTDSELCDGTGLIWIKKTCNLVKDAATPIYEERIGNGFIISLPFDLNDLMSDTRYEKRAFVGEGPKNPDEVVSVVSKGGIQKLISNCLCRLHHKRNLPYMHLWYYPDKANSIFSFRIDVDSSGYHEFKKTLDMARESNIRMTWFVNTGRFGRGLDYAVIEELKKSNQEIESHGHLHEVFDTYEDNLKNIERSGSVLDKYGVKVRGFSSPFGRSNAELARAINDLNLRFNSDFSVAYNGFPFRPLLKTRVADYFQIPIFPVCVGSLLEKGYSPREMKDYFEGLIDKLYLSNLPIILYGHPRGVSRFPDVFEGIVKKIKGLDGIEKMTFLEWCDWWDDRGETEYSADYLREKDLIEINLKNCNGGLKERLYFRIVIKEGDSARFIHAPVKNKKIYLKGNDFEELKKPSDIEFTTEKLSSDSPRIRLFRILSKFLGYLRS